jgi:hypothetical protein
MSLSFDLRRPTSSRNRLAPVFLLFAWLAPRACQWNFGWLAAVLAQTKVLLHIVRTRGRKKATIPIPLRGEVRLGRSVDSVNRMIQVTDFPPVTVEGSRLGASPKLESELSIASWPICLQAWGEWWPPSASRWAEIDSWLRPDIPSDEPHSLQVTNGWSRQIAGLSLRSICNRFVD